MPRSLPCIAAMVGPVALLALVPAAAAQDNLVTFGFTDLRSEFDGIDTFRAVSSNSGGFSTSGDVSRLAAPGGTADYGLGVDPSLVLFEISVENLTGTTADGSGNFQITDADGDFLRGQISGTWSTVGAGAIFFTGQLTGVEFVDNGTLDAMFDGPNGGAFSTAFDTSGPYTGATVGLMLTQSGFFTSGFSDVSSQFSGVVVPAPAGGAVLALAALGARRRRR